MSKPRQPGRVPLYDQIKQSLRAEIEATVPDPAAPFITEREVCARFGVSTITAVHALNDLVAEGLLERHRGRGTFVAERPGRVGQMTIACIVHGLHGLHGAHLARLLTGIESTCDALGYQLVLVNSAGSAAREEAALRRALGNGSAGIILYPVEGQGHPGVFGEIRRRGVPLVMVDRYRPDVVSDAVVADNVDLGYQLTKCLLDLGHQRIAMLWGETDCTSVRDRLTGHLQALREAGATVVPDLTVLRPYESLPTRERTADLEARLELDEPPSVFMCANGYVLAAAAHDLVLLGVDVPGGVELACMDDAGPYDLLPLAMVAGVLPSEEMGAQAMRLLSERIDHRQRDSRSPGTRTMLPITVRARASAPGHLRTMSPLPRSVVERHPAGS